MTAKIKFQSLFWWILRYAVSESIVYFVMTMFQSLFWWILRYAPTSPYSIVVAFRVSILVLVDLTLCQQRKTASSYRQVVSILVLVDLTLCLKSNQPSFSVFWSFNPCFGGSYVMPVFSTLDDIPCYVVSILVLVDLTLCLFQKLLHIAFLSVSILVLVDLTLCLWRWRGRCIIF